MSTDKDTIIRVLEKWFISICLFIAIYFTVMCKCSGVLLSCKKMVFYILVGLPLVYIFIRNTFT